MKFYYIVWSDAINGYLKSHRNKPDWKLSLLFIISFIQGLNIMLIIVWLKYFNLFSFSLVKTSLFPGSLLDNYLDVFIEFVIPFMIINYFLILYKDKYSNIIIKYSNLKRRYSIIYSVFVIILITLSLLIYRITK
jgi:hypothetical protein